ncbi:hypothetical protein LNTAR_10231 [Lentisphaera araneosa HTCC2155]|uniref:DUF3293 domain-containing protein n=1 Tax=Lentisphaera araneosa HTCC2155 TaxID=313628 RepID=A6DIJ9_9BACT|nr:DUF3293 domain-containing protein [Lentisphaera araneosa]EDM28285.1 hypothetical protein LNTAR_10231 [Lentisphaera araneosa HTCC2155]
MTKEQHIENYLKAEYQVFDKELTTSIKIGINNPQLNSFLKASNHNTWAFITAWNPYSLNETTDTENHSRNQTLLEDLNVQDIQVISGKGIDPSGEYSGEDSFLITGISRDDAIQLGQKYQQNAIVFGEIYKNPELIWTRD